MDWLSTVFSYLGKRKPLPSLVVLYVWILLSFDVAGLLTFLRDLLHEEIQIRILYWYLVPWHLIWLFWSLGRCSR